MSKDEEIELIFDAIVYYDDDGYLLSSKDSRIGMENWFDVPKSCVIRILQADKVYLTTTEYDFKNNIKRMI